MADSASDPFSGPGDNTEYTITRRPDLQCITTGARIHYECVWKGIGSAPRVIGQDQFGQAYNRLRDGVRWYTYGAGRPEGFFTDKVKKGPIQTYWDLTWDDTPGQYTVIAEIRNSDTPGKDPTFRHRSQQIGDAAAMLGDWLDKLLKQGVGPTPEQAERELARYRVLLDETAKKTAPPDPAKHKEAVDKWADLAGRLRDLFNPSDGKRRIPVRAVHLETETQAQRPLLLFLTELPDVTRPMGKGGAIKEKQWGLVDWTDASHPRFRGHYEGTGATAKEAIESCFSSWDWGNSYPAGNVRYEIPPEIRPIIGGDVRRQMDTNGTNLTEEIVIVFQWIAIGTMLIAGFCFIFVGIPTLTTLAMGTSMVASTAGSAISVAHRWRNGLFDWKADAIDGLTIASGLIGLGAWARGAKVLALGKAGQKVDCVFLGARLGSDALQGILIVEADLKELDDLMKDPSISPEERSRRMLMLLADLATVGAMTAVSLRASAAAADALTTKPKFLKADDPRVNVPDEIMEKLAHPKAGAPPVDLTKPPVGEGHTTEAPQHKTKMQTGHNPAPVSGPLRPSETDFAKAYRKEGHPWQEYFIGENEISLEDKDGFVFNAKVDNGTLHILAVPRFDPAVMPEYIPRFGPTKRDSTVLRAKELYPKMYKHFKQVGKEITALEGPWMWTNYEDAHTKFVELVYAERMSPTHAAKIAVFKARTYENYHAKLEITLGLKLTRVVSAVDNESTKQFFFRIEAE